MPHHYIINSFNKHFHTNYIQTLISYLTRNAVHFHYKDQSVYAVQGNIWYLMYELQRSQTHCVAKCRVS